MRGKALREPAKIKGWTVAKFTKFLSDVISGTNECLYVAIAQLWNATHRMKVAHVGIQFTPIDAKSRLP